MRDAVHHGRLVALAAALLLSLPGLPAAHGAPDDAAVAGATAAPAASAPAVDAAEAVADALHGGPASDRNRPVEDTIAERALPCMQCHGADGRAAPDGFYPRIAGKPAGYLFGQLQGFREGRRHNAPMLALLRNLDDPFLAELAAHFAAQKLPYPAPRPVRATAPEREAGRRLVEEGDPARQLPACTGCHGRRLTGVEPGVPGLAGLPADYLAAQLGAWQSGQRHSIEPDCMATIARRITPPDVTALLAWITSLPVPEPSNPDAAADAPKRPLDCGMPQTAAVPPAADAPASPGSAASQPAVQTSTAPPAPAARGAYLLAQGNCAACHTARGAPPYAGGRPVPTPFGTVWGPNLTPDAQTGIGRWSAEQFHDALHRGRAADGRALLPAFPFTSFHRIPRADSDAMYAQLRTLAPVSRERPAHTLTFPLGSGLAQWAWRLVGFDTGDEPVDGNTFEGAAAGSPQEVQRGRYLVLGPGHCAQCHSARNALGAWRDETALDGADMAGSGWYAPSLRRGWRPRSPQGWVDFLATGVADDAVAMGPMADIVQTSLKFWSDADLRAVGRYLDTLRDTATPAPAAARGPTPQVWNESARTTRHAETAGARLYDTHCARCHGDDGTGRPGRYPALAGNPILQSPSADNVVRVVLEGGYAPTTPRHPRPFGMPPFASVLHDADVAVLINHLRRQWGPSPAGAAPVDAARVRALRSSWID